MRIHGKIEHPFFAGFCTDFCFVGAVNQTEICLGKVFRNGISAEIFSAIAADIDLGIFAETVHQIRVDTVRVNFHTEIFTLCTVYFYRNKSFPTVMAADNGVHGQTGIIRNGPDDIAAVAGKRYPARIYIGTLNAGKKRVDFG